ncbi:hypothetical protein DH2020_034706 [Rehmannia glutinosa]|uniref:Protein kinase domain-containing protein n=1 Tax=Rehmannia glutinosa TaxID=99300 RepID=A0ABR0VB49_REHGL
MVIRKSNFLNFGFLAAWFFCLSSLCIATPTQNCNPNDYSALKEFANQLVNGPVKFSWSNGTDCCKWDGVVCEDGGIMSSSSNRVVMLRLSGKGLKGRVSESLCKLDHLKSLDLSHNYLEGRLPLEFSNLKQLEVLDFSHNMLVGPAFGPIAGLKSIRSLNLSSNSFSGNLIGIFPKLVALNISNNLFTGEISSKVCSFSKSIRVLDLSSNHFTGEIPDSLYSLSSLEHLTISSNNFSGQLSVKISKLSNLKTFVLCGNRFSGCFPNVFGNLTELEQLVAHSNSFSGPLPSSLAFCPKLRVLDLQNNSLSGPIDLDFSRLSNLCSLDLASNRFSGPLPESLSSCHELKILSLAKNNLTGQIPQSYANLSSLTFLSLSNNSLVNLSGSLSVLKRCKNLTTLILTKNFHGEEIPENMTGFENLLILALGNCGLNGRIPNWLFNCRKLQVLDLSWNHLEGNIPSWIGYTELESLISVKSYTYSLNTSTGIPLFVKRNQSSSGLQYNQASSFPPSILLSNNRLNGTIWPEIGKLKQLHVLDLSRNSITGTIPSSISNMINLETLDLSYNDLHGLIPSSFNQLTFLSKFSVANNHLEGAIPTGGQFLSFSSSSFEGNPGICGKLISPCAVNNVGLQKPTPSPGRYRQTILTNQTSLAVEDLVSFTKLTYQWLESCSQEAFGDCGQMEREFQAEVEALSRAQHKNLVSLQGYCRYGNDRLLIYSYMENGSLDYWLHEKKSRRGSFLNWDTRLRIAQGSARGLAYLHKEPNIVHRDIKTSNILLDEKFEAHLADFGLSRLLHPYDTHVTTDLVGTLGYIPPEYGQTLTATFRGDVYSFGIVLLELITGRRPVEVCKGKNCRDVVGWVYQMKSERREVEIFDSGRYEIKIVKNK